MSLENEHLGGNLLFCDYSILFVLNNIYDVGYNRTGRNAVERIESIVTLSSTEHRKYASNLHFVGCRKELFPQAAQCAPRI